MTRTQLSKLQGIIYRGNLVEQNLETATVSEAKLAGGLKCPASHMRLHFQKVLIL